MVSTEEVTINGHFGRWLQTVTMDGGYKRSLHGGYTRALCTINNKYTLPLILTSNRCCQQ